MRPKKEKSVRFLNDKLKFVKEIGSRSKEPRDPKEIAMFLFYLRRSSVDRKCGYSGKYGMSCSWSYSFGKQRVFAWTGISR